MPRTLLRSVRKELGKRASDCVNISYDSRCRDLAEVFLLDGRSSTTRSTSTSWPV